MSSYLSIMNIVHKLALVPELRLALLIAVQVIVAAGAQIQVLPIFECVAY